MANIYVLLVLVVAANALDWESWKQQYGKTYLGRGEEVLRKKVWESNLQIVQQHNALADQGKATYRMGMNAYADLYNEEFMALKNGGCFLQPKEKKSGASTFQPLTGVSLPAAIDWRDYGYVTDVKDQGQCGSCWAFSSTGSLEGQLFVQLGQLVPLSEQQLVDCSRSYGNAGCNGGWMDKAFEYIKNAGGLETETSYPYTARDGRCYFDLWYAMAVCTGYTDIPTGSESALQQAVGTVGPVSVAIDATGSGFQMYTSGVYYNPSCSTSYLDHAVLAAGYGTLNGQDYWLVKNSWGTSWGDQGYIKMARNKNNHCGIGPWPATPTSEHKSSPPPRTYISKFMDTLHYYCIHKIDLFWMKSCLFNFGECFTL
uniref:Cathepsin L n=1 Tax=Eptatretus burgeri TaxID=7764 RepID=A0A8C4QDW2_EPTBU